MPYCPECKTEYRPGFDTCADCGSLLVDSPPECEDTLPSLKEKILSAIGQILTVVSFSTVLVLVTLVLGKASADEWQPWLTLSAPCVLLFAFGWFLHDWLSPILVWISWTVIGLVMVMTGSPLLSGILIALTVIPATMALPVICGIYFGKTRKPYLFFVPILAYAVLFVMVTKDMPG